jgi:predicted metalloprotease with PDZ domain
VREGQILARLDDSTARSSLRLAEAQLAAAKGGVKENDVRLAEAKVTYGRLMALLKEYLRLDKEITEKVSKEGLDALTDEERKELPRETDFSNEDYRHRIRQVFDQHRNAESKNFDFFLQAQVLWDETMAESIDAYFKKNPDHQMAVIAGGGHLVYGTGIPKRAYRRNGLSYTVILNDGDIERNIADFIIFPQPLDGMTAPKLMATFKEEKGRMVFQDFVKESPSKAAGIKVGDVLVSLDGVPVTTLPEIKTALYYKSKGDIMKVKVIRKRFLLGEKEMEFEVKL